MRTTVELLEIVDKNLCYLKDGLCFLVADLHKWGDISYDEAKVLTRYIWFNRPSRYSSIAAFKSRNSSYFWPSGERVPRRKWLEKQIKKLS